MFLAVAAAGGAGSIFREFARRAGNVAFVDDLVPIALPTPHRSSVMLHGPQLTMCSKGSSKCGCSHTYLLVLAPEAG